MKRDFSICIRVFSRVVSVPVPDVRRCGRSVRDAVPLYNILSHHISVIVSDTDITPVCNIGNHGQRCSDGKRCDNLVLLSGSCPKIDGFSVGACDITDGNNRCFSPSGRSRRTCRRREGPPGQDRCGIESHSPSRGHCLRHGEVRFRRDGGLGAGPYGPDRPGQSHGQSHPAGRSGIPDRAAETFRPLKAEYSGLFPGPGWSRPPCFFALRSPLAAFPYFPASRKTSATARMAEGMSPAS